MYIYIYWSLVWNDEGLQVLHNGKQHFHCFNYVFTYIFISHNVQYFFQEPFFSSLKWCFVFFAYCPGTLHLRIHSLGHFRLNISMYKAVKHIIMLCIDLNYQWPFKWVLGWSTIVFAHGKIRSWWHFYDTRFAMNVYRIRLRFLWSLIPRFQSTIV